MGIPRERPVVRPITCNPIQPYATVNTDLSRISVGTPYAPETVLRQNGNSNLLISNSHSGASSPFSLIETSELQVEPNLSVTPTVSQPSTSAPLTHSYLPINLMENELAETSDEQQTKNNTFEEWPAEEEENYQNMLRLLTDGNHLMRNFDGSYGQG